MDNSLLHSIETIIIDWSHQIRDVLSKDSAQALLDGLHPLPRVEFEFWDARLMNLQCIHEQVGPHSTQQLSPCWLSVALPGTPRYITGMFLSPGRAPSPEGWTEGSWFFGPQLNRPKVNKIVEILEKAKSCYWPALQNVYMNVTQGEPDTVIHKATGCSRDGCVDCLSLTPGSYVTQ